MRHLAKTLPVGLGLGLAAVLLAPAANAAPGLHLDKQDLSSKQCNPAGADAKQVVDVHYTLVNDYDSGFGGNAWANDTVDRHLRIYQVSGGFCAVVADHGTFVTFDGISPSGSAHVDAGVTGNLEGGYVTDVFTGHFSNPGSLPTHGNLGTTDLGCDMSFNCAAHPSFLSYVPDASSTDLAQWGWIYHAGKNGTWLNQDGVAAADGGDITG